VRKSQPGPTPNARAYLARTFGVSWAGSNVIEYMNTSRPIRDARSFWTLTRFAVLSGQMASFTQFV